MLVRPKPSRKDGEGCPYCPGAESASGPEIAAYRPAGALPNDAGWTVRVVPETDPYFRIEHELIRKTNRSSDEPVQLSTGRIVMPFQKLEGGWAAQRPDGGAKGDHLAHIVERDVGAPGAVHRAEACEIRGGRIRQAEACLGLFPVLVPELTR